MIDVEKCRTVCTQRACLQVCPADLYELSDQGDMTVNWEGCLECGTCLICCDAQALRWHLPARRLRGAVPHELERRGRRAARPAARTQAVPSFGQTSTCGGA